MINTYNNQPFGRNGNENCQIKNRMYIKKLHNTHMYKKKLFDLNVFGITLKIHTIVINVNVHV